MPESPPPVSAVCNRGCARWRGWKPRLRGLSRLVDAVESRGRARWRGWKPRLRGWAASILFMKLHVSAQAWMRGL